MVAPRSVALGPEREHSSPEPSLHGVSLGALPLLTRWRKLLS